MLHENDAAQILYDICKNDHMRPSEVKEGKIELIAECDGLLKINSEKLNAVNSLGEIMTNKEGETNVDGLFAAGDVTDCRNKQVIIAAGEGAAAALAAHEYLLRSGL